MFEVGEDECGAGDVADFAGAGGDVLEGAPALVEQGEPAFSPRQRRDRWRALRERVSISRSRPSGGCLTGMWMPIPVPSSPGVGQGGQSGGGGAVEGGQGVDAGGGQIMHRAGLGIGDPQREPARGQDGLDAAAVAVGLAGVPQVDDLAFHADSGFFAPVGRDDVAGTCPQAPAADRLASWLPLQLASWVLGSRSSAMSGSPARNSS